MAATIDERKSPHAEALLHIRATSWKGLVDRIANDSVLSTTLNGEMIKQYVQMQEEKIADFMATIDWTVTVFPSKTSGKADGHTVKSDGLGLILCTCTASQFGKDCWAVKQVRAKELVKALVKGGGK